MADSMSAHISMDEGAVAEMAGISGPAGNGGEPAVVVRTDFRSTVFWQPDIVTGEDGTAEVEVTFPDSLTNWKAVARGVAREDGGPGPMLRETLKRSSYSDGADFLRSRPFLTLNDFELDALALAQALESLHLNR